MQLHSRQDFLPGVFFYALQMCDRINETIGKI